MIARARALLVALLVVSAARADVVVLRDGGRVRGRVLRERPDVLVNVFRSAFPGAAGSRRFAPGDVLRIERTLPRPEHRFQRLLAAAKDADDLAALARSLLAEDREEEAVHALERALLRDPGHALSRRLLGARVPERDRARDLALAGEFLAAPDAEARARVLRRIREERDFPFDEVHLARALRSLGQPRGVRERRPLTLRADRLPGAEYALFVPLGYDPLEPTPVVVALHGGGAGGARAELVVGSGARALPFYRAEAERRGWILVCPTAVAPGWEDRKNSALLDAVLAEVCALYNVDRNRIYLTGHSMGGGGAWAQGERLADTWAAIAPTASFDVRGIETLARTRTGFWVYHSADDPRTPVEEVRASMRELVDRRIDFVYTEVDGRGHALPADVVRAAFDFFEPRRRALRSIGGYRPAIRPLSSFRLPVDRDESRYLPDLDRAGEPVRKELDELLDDLERGGGAAKRAVEPLVSHADRRTGARVARILRSPRSAPDVRRYAAEVLGRRGERDQRRSLERVLLVEKDESALLAILDALSEIGDPEAGRDVVRFLRRRHAYFRSRLVDTRIHYSDWVRILPTLARASEVAASFEAKRAAKTISEVVLDGVLLSGIEVLHDPELQDPRPAARALAASACRALARLEDPVAVPFLERLGRQGRWSRDPVIRAHVHQTLRTLR